MLITLFPVMTLKTLFHNWKLYQYSWYKKVVSGNSLECLRFIKAHEIGQNLKVGGGKSFLPPYFNFNIQL